MLRLLGKLEQLAERWVDRMDNQVGEPIVHVMNGQVFVHDPKGVEQAFMEMHSSQSAQSAEAVEKPKNELQPKSVAKPKRQQKPTMPEAGIVQIAPDC